MIKSKKAKVALTGTIFSMPVRSLLLEQLMMLLRTATIDQLVR